MSEARVVRLVSDGRFVVQRTIPSHPAFGQGGEETAYVEIGHEHDPDLPEWVSEAIRAWEEATQSSQLDAESGVAPETSGEVGER